MCNQLIFWNLVTSFFTIVIIIIPLSHWRFEVPLQKEKERNIKFKEPLVAMALGLKFLYFCQFCSTTAAWLAPEIACLRKLCLTAVARLFLGQPILCFPSSILQRFLLTGALGLLRRWPTHACALRCISTLTPSSAICLAFLLGRCC